MKCARIINIGFDLEIPKWYFYQLSFQIKSCIYNMGKGLSRYHRYNFRIFRPESHTNNIEAS